MSNYTLSDLTAIRIESEENGLRLDHHQISKILDHLSKQISKYTRMINLIEHYINSDRNLNQSIFIGAFLIEVAKKMAKEAIGEISGSKQEESKNEST